MPAGQACTGDRHARQAQRRPPRPRRRPRRASRTGPAAAPAARHDGFFPIDLEHPDQLAEVVATLSDPRDSATTPYDIVVALPPGADPEPYIEAGATPETTLDRVQGVLHDGPYETKERHP
ncbi:hypothetical protein [Nonomuraea dietziae]|uniref:hypothetical protein n=1 Tax=Nonomuraea dietziae TaxID=65515 RepID=UPI003437652C